MLNKVMLIGNLGRDPEMNYTPSGTAVTKFSLAVSRTSKVPGSGERREETEWFNIVAWEKLAETCSAYLHKGSKVYIEGRISQRKYTDREGIQRNAMDIIASNMEILTPKTGQGGSENFLAGESTDNDPLGDLDEHPF
ncbi:MAG: single-stranded DNA-binding protein [Ktedonobacteraceae bacterium]|jgi:single-strand DNA-binding protein